MIELGNISTWPDALRECIAAGHDALVAYEAERRGIDERLRTNVPLRLDPPANPHAGMRRELIAHCSALLTPHDLLAWHCTRLLPAEVERIRQDGLKVHDTELFRRRLSEALAAGALSEPESQELLTRSSAGDRGRKGVLWFVTERELLRSEPDVGPLLSHWGGEAIYSTALPDGTFRSRLASIGRPAIVSVRIPTASLADMWLPLAERLVNRWLAAEGTTTEHGWSFDAKLRTDLPPAAIHAVDVLGSPTFDSMTRHQSWREPLRGWADLR